ncbi:MAG: hypothetical protein IH613_04975 [Desulfuromonadales bacterium]|nr:hypothetical protein [Desulfuromonadales bacterium]
MITKKTDDVHVLKTGACFSLSGRSELKYEFGYSDKIIMFRVVGNTGSGHFSSAWIPLDAILELLNKAKEPFSLSVFKNLYPGQSINNTGFLGAALKKEELIVCEKRQYICKDSKAFMADLNKLFKTAKPAKTANTPRKPVKAEQKEEPKC